MRYLEADSGKSERQAKFLPMIQEGLERINAVIQHMLTFAPLSAYINETEFCSVIKLTLKGD